MQIKTLVTIQPRMPRLLPLFLISALLLNGAVWAQSTLPFHPARRADDFVETIGVATHWSYPDTPYGNAYENVKSLLASAGIRYVRDGFSPHLSDLYASHGIRATVTFNPGNLSDIVETIKANPALISMVEGPNEVALFPQSAKYLGQGFPEGPRRWMKDLYKTLKASPETRDIPIIAPSMGKTGVNAALAPLGDFDFCVMHSYAGGNMPSSSLYSEINNNLTDAYSLLAEGATLKPIVVTESGYHTALGSKVVLAGVQPGISERAQARYLPRHFAEYFNAGIFRTFTYEFVDEFADYKKDEHEATNAEACFGIVKKDLTPKPAYHSLKNLIALLNESHWDVSTQKWQRPTPDFLPRALRFDLSGETQNVHQTLLQKAEGDYYLLLWQEVPSFDLQKREDILPPAARVTLSLPSPANLALFQPSTGVVPIRPPDVSVTSLNLDIPDEVVVVRISLKPPTMGTVAPQTLRVSTLATRDNVTFSWKFLDKIPPAALFIYRSGRLVGTIEDSKQITFTDGGLLPGKGYPYQLVSCDNTGQMAPTVPLIVQTKAEYPDLIVTDIGFVDKPTAGQPVHLTATIKNIGNAPTPANLTHGVAFSVDGQFVFWSDDFAGPLKPGESKKVTSNNGPKGVSHWVAVSGMHKFSAMVDDVRRIPEKTHDNNSKEVTLTVP